MTELICFRLIDSDSPAEPLKQAVRILRDGQSNEVTYKVDPIDFRKVPNAPFSYWVSENIRNIFEDLPAFENEERTARQGLTTANNFQFVRLSWEVLKNDNNQGWVSILGGGTYSPYYADIHLEVNWKNKGDDMKDRGQVPSSHYYYRPGLTWLRRTKRFCPRVFPKGIIFTNASQAAFNSGKEFATCALFFSNISQILISLSLGTTSQDDGGTNPQFECGTVNNIPYKLIDKYEAKLSSLAKSAWSHKRSTDTANQTSHSFYAPALSPSQLTAAQNKPLLTK